MMILAAGGILTKESDNEIKVLLVHRTRYNDWSFPKGKNIMGETIEETAVREIKEETNMDVEVSGLIDRLVYKVNDVEKVNVYFSVKIIRENHFIPNNEVDEIRWVTIDEAKKMLSYPDLIKILESI